MYPIVIDTMYSADIGRYVRIMLKFISTPPMNISYAACRPITIPTAVTILRWEYLSFSS